MDYFTLFFLTNCQRLDPYLIYPAAGLHWHLAPAWYIGLAGPLGCPSRTSPGQAWLPLEAPWSAWAGRLDRLSREARQTG